MRNMKLVRAAALIAAVVLTGCQTSNVDSTKTSALDADLELAPVSELASGQLQFAEANYGLMKA